MLGLNLVQLCKSRLFSALDSAGPGIKVLLMDKESTSMISVAVPQSEIMKKEVYLFEQLETEPRPAKNARLQFLRCVCVLRPTSANITRLCGELAAPRYTAYHVFFTHLVPRADVKRLAEADAGERVKDVREIFLDVFAVSAHLFSLGVARPLGRDGADWAGGAQCGGGGQAALERTVAGLTSLVVSLRAAADIAYARGSPAAERLAQRLAPELAAIEAKDAYSPSQHQRLTILLLDRRHDPVTPLLNQWTYQAMLHELLGIHNNVMDLSGRPDVPSDLTKVVLSAENDDFFRNNMYANFGEIGATIKVLVDEYQKQMKGQSRIESIGDIKDFVASYPEFKRMSGTVTKHVALVSELSAIVAKHALLEVSEFEQDLACGADGGAFAAQLQRFLQLLDKPDLRLVDARRILLLLALRHEQDVKVHLESIARKMPRDADADADADRSIDLYKRIEAMRKFAAPWRAKAAAAASAGRNGGVGGTVAKMSRKILTDLRGIENVYTRHRPPLRDIITDLLKGGGGGGGGDLELIGECRANKVVAFVIGGVTYEESAAVAALNRELGAEIVIGGTDVINGQQFIENVIFTSGIG